MSREISLFPSYDQKENRTTNYCLLVLRMLYEENPKYLSDILTSILGEGAPLFVGVRFLQQQKGESGVPDGTIVQKPFIIQIETKHHGHFGCEQLKAHLRDLSASGNGDDALRVLIALGIVETPHDPQFEPIKAFLSQECNSPVMFTALGFNDFYTLLQGMQLPKNLSDVVEEFGVYLDSEGLLSNWRNRLDVVNCANDFEQVTKLGIYRCPVRGGAYAHRRSKYFGTYRNKCVESVALIRAIFEFMDIDGWRLKWKNNDEDDQSLENAAQDAYDRYLPRMPGNAQVFLLGELHRTDFRKDTSGGMYGSKQYFDVSGLKPTDVMDLAAKLDGKEWKDLKPAGKHE